MVEQALDYTEHVQIAEGTYWVGFADTASGLHCNPYLIVDGNEAVLLDSGSRNDFSTVMLKIMRTGTNPKNIKRLIYHHYDPDLCGNLPHIEALIQNSDLHIISHFENNIFIDYYSARSPMLCIEEMGMRFRFTSGRELRFVRTPYSHSPGSFITFDTKTKVLFSSDIFGSYDKAWSLFTELTASCTDCAVLDVCPLTGKRCQMKGILDFHRRIMTSRKALLYALDQIEALDAVLIAPQHGRLLHTPEVRKAVISQIRRIEDIGIDHFLKEHAL